MSVHFGASVLRIPGRLHIAGAILFVAMSMIPRDSSGLRHNAGLA
jgi:hypothetical protein